MLDVILKLLTLNWKNLTNLSKLIKA